MIRLVIKSQRQISMRDYSDVEQCVKKDVIGIGTRKRGVLIENCTGKVIEITSDILLWIMHLQTARI